MTDVLHRRYRFKVYPTRRQETALQRLRELHRWLYNDALEKRIAAYRETGKRPTLYDQQKNLTALRAKDPAYRALSRTSLNMTLGRLDLAFQAFYRRAKAGAGRRSGFPRFCGRDHFPGFAFGLSKGRWSGWKFTHLGGKRWRLYVKGVDGLIKVRGALPDPDARIKEGTLTWHAGKLWFSVLVEQEARRRCGSGSARLDWDIPEGFTVTETVDGGHDAGLEAPETTVSGTAEGRIATPNYYARPASAPATAGLGGDHENHDRLGGAHFAPATAGLGGDHESSSSRARTPAAPATAGLEGDHERHSARRKSGSASDADYARIKALQRKMSRQQRGSGGYRRTRLRKAKIEARLARRREDWSHRFSTALAARYEVVSVPDESVAGVTQSGRGDARQPGGAVS